MQNNERVGHGWHAELASSDISAQAAVVSWHGCLCLLEGWDNVEEAYLSKMETTTFLLRGD